MVALAAPVDVAASAAVDPLQGAEAAMVQNRLDAARALLAPLAAHPTGDRARDNQVLFLLGLIDLAENDMQSAIARFHRVLVSEPGRLRVRLELGRAYFLARDYANAERQFRLARAGRLPPVVRANVDAYLGAIRNLRRVSYSFALAIAGDSNRNAGPAIDGVTLYGVPFQLPGVARQNAGLGLSFDASAEYAPRLTQRVRWRGGVVLHRAQYAQTLYDDMIVTLYEGPHLALKKADLNLLTSVSRHWYGERVYADTLAASLDGLFYLSARLGIGGAAVVNHTRYALNPLQSGSGASASANLVYTPAPTTTLRAAAAFGHQHAQFAAYASRSDQFGLAYTREFAGGLTLGLAPGYTRTAYDAPLAAFDATRIDHQISLQASLLDRRIDWRGLTPRITYTYTRNASTIDLYRFHRNRVELGITRAF